MFVKFGFCYDSVIRDPDPDYHLSILIYFATLKKYKRIHDMIFAIHAAHNEAHVKCVLGSIDFDSKLTLLQALLLSIQPAEGCEVNENIRREMEVLYEQLQMRFPFRDDSRIFVLGENAPYLEKTGLVPSSHVLRVSQYTPDKFEMDPDSLHPACTDAWRKLTDSVSEVIIYQKIKNKKDLDNYVQKRLPHPFFQRQIWENFQTIFSEPLEEFKREAHERACYK